MLLLQVLVQVDPVMAAWVCGEEPTATSAGDESDALRNPFFGMDSATSVPSDTPLSDPSESDDVSAAASTPSPSHRYLIHPASLSATSALLSFVVGLLKDSRPDGSDADAAAAHNNMLVQAKHMYDMTRVLKTELPADAAMERL